jgi:hypothetical protein
VKKTHSFDKLSDRVCLEPGCDKKIKLRLVESEVHRRKFNHCYKHQPKHTISGHSKRGRS